MGQVASIPRKNGVYVLELHEWYRKFVKECPSGLITLHEFRKYFCDHTVGSQSAEYAEQIFRTLDNNGDGIVDFREYVTAISMLAHGTPEDKLKWSFRLYDKDRDGSITRAEMLDIMKAVYKMSVKASISKVDPMTAEECTNRIFIRLDKDHDAVISQQEFVDGSLDDDWIREMLECDLSTVEIQATPKCVPLHSRSSSSREIDKRFLNQRELRCNSSPCLNVKEATASEEARERVSDLRTLMQCPCTVPLDLLFPVISHFRPCKE